MALSTFLPASIDEDSIRRLCSPSVFASADSIQRSKQIIAASVDDDRLEGHVRGVWDRVHHVTVHVKAGRLTPFCDRDGATYCQHVVAMLLYCLRKSTEFGQSEVRLVTFRSPGASHHETPAEELLHLFDRHTMNQLRQMAALRGVRLSGTRKSELILQLVTALSDPASVDRAINALTPEERRSLDAAYFVAGLTHVQPALIDRPFHELGGSGTAPISTPLSAGLVIAQAEGITGPIVYTVAQAVARRLPPIDGLIRPATGDLNTSKTGLGVIELMLYLSLETQQRPLVLENTMKPTALEEGFGMAPPGFQHDRKRDGSRPIVDSAGISIGELLKPRSFLSESDRKELPARLGVSPERVAFVIQLMLAGNFAKAYPELAIRPDEIRRLLERLPEARTFHLVRSWLAIAGSAEFAALVEESGPFRLYTKRSYSMPVEPRHVVAIAQLARFLVRLLGRLRIETNYDFRSIVEFTLKMSPFAVPALNQLRIKRNEWEPYTICRVNDRGAHEPVDLRTPEGFSFFGVAAIKSLLVGPLTWLGIVETEFRPDSAGVVRVLKTATAILERTEAGSPAPAADPIVVSDTMTVLVPTQTAELGIHGLLARAGELIEATPSGLRYRITPAGVRRVFESGMTGPEFANALVELSGRKLPAKVSQTLETWWRGYGSIRLYDDLAVLEFGDETLQAELLAVTSLDASMLARLSPRAVAIDPAAAEKLVADLSAQGYALRRVDES